MYDFSFKTTRLYDVKMAEKINANTLTLIIDQPSFEKLLTPLDLNDEHHFECKDGSGDQCECIEEKAHCPD